MKKIICLQGNAQKNMDKQYEKSKMVRSRSI